MTDTLFFILAKLAGILIQPGSWIMLGLAVTVIALFRGRGGLARSAGLATLLMMLVIGVLPLGDALLASLERRYPARPETAAVDGIIVLGGAEAPPHAGSLNLNEAGERFTEAARLARRHPGARLLFTGGSGALRDLALARARPREALRGFFTERGIAADRLILETASRNTAENARLGLEQADPRPGENWLLVTSAFHMPRAMRSFARAGWEGVTAWPVDYRGSDLARGIGWNPAGNLVALETAIREHVGLLAYDLTGR